MGKKFNQMVKLGNYPSRKDRASKKLRDFVKQRAETRQEKKGVTNGKVVQ